ncbi:MAG: CDP-alcohol phosphatidyltransferase family protein [Clostridia bacterium]|nr:CDP-alcohol phosphatidyltransferase family protein [Clostridia bacterium]
MIGYYNPSVIATYISLVCSIVGISFALVGNMLPAFCCIMVCGILDMIDGPIARKCKRTEDEKSFGIQIDSLCDVVCFGAQAAVICLKMAGVTWYSAIIAGLFVMTGVIRLGFFNVQEINRVKVDPGRRKTYDGLPITTSSLILPLVAVIDIVIRPACGWIYLIAMVITGFFYIAPVHIPKLHTKGMILLALFGAALFTTVIVFGKTLTAA